MAQQARRKKLGQCHCICKFSLTKGKGSVDFSKMLSGKGMKQSETERQRDRERERAEIEAELATTELQLIEAGACEISKASPQSSNRKKPGSQVTRTETPAATKLKYIEEMKPAKNSFNHLKDFWKAQVEKYGLQKKSLQNILSKEEHWKELVAQKDLKSKRKKRRARGSEPQELAERLPFKTSPRP